MILEYVRRRRLEQSLAVMTALLVMGIVGTAMLVVHSRNAKAVRRALEGRGLSVAQSIGAVATPSLLSYNYPALQIASEAASGDAGVLYVVLHDKEGVVAGLAGRAAPPHGPIHRSVLATARPAVIETAVDLAGGGRTDALEVAVPVRVAGSEEPWGVVRVALDTAPVQADLRRLQYQLAGLGIALSVLAVAASRVLARRIAAPLRRLAWASEALAAGDTPHRLAENGTVEFQHLARAFNTMMDRIEAKARESAAFQGALEQLNATLEAQVRERTRALAESEAQYKTLVEHSPFAILLVQDGRLRFANPAFAATFGIAVDDALRTDFDLGRIFEPSSAALARGRIAAWERGETAEPVEILGRTPDGQVRHLELRGSRIEYAGRPAAECLMVDMTEAKRLRERLSESEKLRALGELAGGVAHDFNNLLGAILGRVQLLRRKPFAGEVDRDLAVIEKAAQDGRETVRRIQEFSRMRRDRPFQHVDLAEILRDSAEMTRSRWKADAEHRNVSIHMELDTPEVPPVLGNAAELREVFTNLVLNAVDAMPQGGRLRLACRRQGGSVMAEVSDTGVGMTEEIRRQLFNPFFTTKGPGGMGLGLSVAYGIATRHGGHIDVRTALGRGTTFSLEFPVAEGAPVAVGGDGAAMPNLVRPGRILVIDDEPEIAEVVRDVLAAEGHTVETALCGRDGVSLARLSDYDLVFTDLGMPDMSGWEVAERIARARPGVPVALVTGWGATLDHAEIRKRGIAAVVHKPFDIEELIRVAAGVLSRGRAASTED